jgi:hypothetical protein
MDEIDSIGSSRLESGSGGKYDFFNKPVFSFYLYGL